MELFYLRMKNSILVLISLVSLQVLGQTIILDSLDNPIPFVRITSSDPNFISNSQLNGNVDHSKLISISDTTLLFLNHVSFEKYICTKKQLISNEKITLDVRPYELPPVNIEAEKTETVFEYRKVKGCFRSFQQDNGVNSYYLDGTVDYYFKDRKFKSKIDRLENRSFVNQELIAAAPSHKTGLTFRAVGIPRLDRKYIPKHLFIDNNLKLDSISSGHFLIKGDQDLTLGVVEVQDAMIKIDFSDPFSLESKKLLKTKVQVTNHNIQLIFRNNGTRVRDIDSFDDLMYLQSHTTYIVSHNKDIEPNNVIVYSELFVENVDSLVSKPNIDFDRNWGLPSSSHYSTDFWNHCDCNLFRPDKTTRLKNLILLD